MWIFETVAAAFSLYSAIPVPQVSWNERNTRYLLCAFPLVGAVIGAAEWGWGAVCSALALPAMLRGAGACLLPAALTGGIHLDGYADVCDALASNAPPEKKAAILHDPHAGAFAIIRLGMYFVGYFALCASLMEEGRTVWAGSFVLSRALSGAALTALPLSSHSALGRTVRAEGSRLAILWGEVLGAAAALWALGGRAGGGMILAAAAVLAGYARTAKTKFDGTSGDLAGWFLQKAEFWMLAVLVLIQYGEAAL